MPSQTLLNQPDFGSCLALIGAVIYAAFFSFAKEARAVYFGLLTIVGMAKYLPESLTSDLSSGKVTEVSLTACVLVLPSRYFARVDSDSFTRSRSQASLDKGGPFATSSVAELATHSLPQYVGPFQSGDLADVEAQNKSDVKGEADAE